MADECNRLHYCIVLAENGAAGRKRIPIAMLGIRYKGTQKIEITRAMLAEMVENFRKRDNGEVPLDYEHGTLDAPPGQAVPAAGWIKALADGPDTDGILWGDVEWTAKAAAMIASREYKYISPVIETRNDNKTGRPQGWTLTSAALTNTPVLQGMPSLVLSERQWMEGGRLKMNDLRMAGAPPESGYIGSDWNPVALEIDQRARHLMGSEPTLGYQAAIEKVYNADPALAEKNWNTIQAEVLRRTKEMMARNGALQFGRALDYGAALQAVLHDDPSLQREYSAARKRWLADGGLFDSDDTQVGNELCAMIREKIAASDRGMDYGDAMRAVLSERPDLKRRYKDSLR